MHSSFGVPGSVEATNSEGRRTRLGGSTPRPTARTAAARGTIAVNQGCMVASKASCPHLFLREQGCEFNRRNQNMGVGRSRLRRRIDDRQTPPPKNGAFGFTNGFRQDQELPGVAFRISERTPRQPWTAVSYLRLPESVRLRRLGFVRCGSLASFGAGVWLCSAHRVWVRSARRA